MLDRKEEGPWRLPAHHSSLRPFWSPGLPKRLVGFRVPLSEQPLGRMQSLLMDRSDGRGWGPRLEHGEEGGQSRWGSKQVWSTHEGHYGEPVWGRCPQSLPSSAQHCPVIPAGPHKHLPGLGGTPWATTDDKSHLDLIFVLCAPQGPASLRMKSRVRQPTPWWTCVSPSVGCTSGRAS